MTKNVVGTSLVNSSVAFNKLVPATSAAMANAR
jgi:hypothetical protein